MATIGLDKLYYAKITEGENGEETYEAPVQLAKAMSADLSVELAEATLYADDGASEVVKEFKSGTLSLGIGPHGRDHRPEQGAGFGIRGRRFSCSGRVSREEVERQVPLFLAVPRYLRYSRDQPCDQRRQYHVLHAHHRRDSLTSQ